MQLLGSGSQLTLGRVSTDVQVMILWRFDRSGGIYLVLVLIGQFCHDVIGHQNVKVVVIGRLLFCCYFQSVYCLFVGLV